jgi:hypothetical protein
MASWPINRQPFCACLSAIEKSPEHFPAVGSWRERKVGNGEDAVHMQAAKQLALRITAKTMRYGMFSSMVRVKMRKAPAMRRH